MFSYTEFNLKTVTKYNYLTFSMLVNGRTQRRWDAFIISVNYRYKVYISSTPETLKNAMALFIFSKVSFLFS